MRRPRISLYAALILTGVSVSHAYGYTRPDIVHQYTISRYDKSRRLRDPESFCVDRKRGEVHVADTAGARIATFSSSGRLIGYWGKEKGFRVPVGILLDEKGRILVTEDNSAVITAYNLRGEKTQSVTIPPAPGKTETSLRRMTRNGSDILVIDITDYRIVILDKNWKVKKIIDRKSRNGAPLGVLQDVAVDDRGQIYAVSSDPPTVEAFDASGRHLRTISATGKMEMVNAFLTGIGIDPRGRIWVVDCFQHMLKVYDSMGNLLFTWGMAGRKRGELFYPVDVDFDDAGNLYVLEKNADRIQVFSVKEHEKTENN